MPGAIAPRTGAGRWGLQWIRTWGAVGRRFGGCQFNPSRALRTRARPSVYGLPDRISEPSAGRVLAKGFALIKSQSS